MCVAFIKQKSILSRILGTLKENMGEMRSGLLPGCRAQTGKPLHLCDDSLAPACIPGLAEAGLSQSTVLILSTLRTR